MIRFTDILLALLGTLILAPISLPLALLLRMTGEGEIFYLQERVGRGGQPFDIIKFATMLKNSPNMGSGTITERDDPRVLPVGRFLRKSKLNEIPQLLNVIRGDMSFVGPRPHAAVDLAGVPADLLLKTQTVMPGVTGIGSLVFRDEESLLHQQSDGRQFYDQVIAPYKAELEVWAISKRGLGFYFSVILLTCLVTLFPKTASLLFSIYPEMPRLPNALQTQFGE